MKTLFAILVLCLVLAPIGCGWSDKSTTSIPSAIVYVVGPTNAPWLSYTWVDADKDPGPDGPLCKIRIDGTHTLTGNYQICEKIPQPSVINGADMGTSLFITFPPVNIAEVYQCDAVPVSVFTLGRTAIVIYVRGRKHGTLFNIDPSELRGCLSEGFTK